MCFLIKICRLIDRWKLQSLISLNARQTIFICCKLFGPEANFLTIQIFEKNPKDVFVFGPCWGRILALT